MKKASDAGILLPDELVFRDDDGGVSVYDARTGHTRMLVSNTTLVRMASVRLRCLFSIVNLII